MTKVTDTEKRILQNIHLTGCMGNIGSMKFNKRLKILQGLINKGLLTEKATLTLTVKGIELSADYKS